MRCGQCPPFAFAIRRVTSGLVTVGQHSCTAIPTVQEHQNRRLPAGVELRWYVHHRVWCLAMNDVRRGAQSDLHNTAVRRGLRLRRGTADQQTTEESPAASHGADLGRGHFCRAPANHNTNDASRAVAALPSRGMAEAYSHPPEIRTSARLLLEQSEVSPIVRLVAGAESLDRPIAHPRIQKNGLSLAGHLHGVVPTRIQVFGETEISYLETLEPATQAERCETLFGLDLSLVVVTRDANTPPALLAAARESQTPVVVASPRSSKTIAALHGALDRLLAPTETRHGVLIDVHSIGTLLLGPSGIGKSECALFLVERGHRLVADDQVVLTRTPTGEVIGRAPPLLRHHLELRGIGIINVRDLFGATAVRDDKQVQLVVELCPQDPEEGFERLGLDDLSHPILGIQMTMLKIPVQPGRNMAVTLEVAARNQLLKRAGRHPAREFVDALSSRLGVSSPQNDS